MAAADVGAALPDVSEPPRHGTDVGFAHDAADSENLNTAPASTVHVEATSQHPSSPRAALGPRGTVDSGVGAGGLVAPPRSVDARSIHSTALPNMRMRAAMLSSPDGFLADHGMGSEAAAESRAHVPLLTRAQPSWTLGKSEMLARIADTAQSNAWMHDHASRKLRSWAAWLMVPVIVITTFTGAATATLGTLFSSTSDPRVQTAVSVALGLLGLFAAILGTLEQKFGFAKQSERHARTSLDWWDLHASTATCLALPFDERPPFNLFAEQVMGQLEAIRRSRPRLPLASISAYRARFGGVLQHPREVGALAPTMPTPYAADHELEEYLFEAGGFAGAENLPDLRRRFMEVFRAEPRQVEPRYTEPRHVEARCADARRPHADARRSIEIEHRV